MKLQTQRVEAKATYSKNDLKLTRFLQIQLQIQKLTEELGLMKEEFKTVGSFSTRLHIVTVEERSRTNPPALKVLIETYGDGVRKLCTESTYKTVKVMSKGDL